MSNEIMPLAMGSEVEYGIRAHKDRKRDNVVHTDLTKNLNVAHVKQFLQNGGRLYKDFGDHPEYASPECTTLEELVTHELAGETLVHQSCRDNADILSIHKRSIAPKMENDFHDFRTSGSHENYETSLKFSEPVIQTLAAHFATRTAFTGAGWYKNGKLMIGQKVHHIEHTSGIGSIGNKALVSTRNEPHVDPALQENMRRLHVTSGDANISPWAIRMKFGTTALLVRMLEAKHSFEDLYLKNPVEAAQFIGSDPRNMGQPLELANGKKMSALDIQEALAERVCYFTQTSRAPRELQEVSHEWVELSQALRRYQREGDVSPLMRNLDWFSKREIVERTRERKPALTNTQIMQIDASYDRISDGLGLRLRKKDRFAYYPGETKTERACKIPPRSRAQLRGAFVLHAYEQYGADDETWSADWASISKPDKKVSLGKVETHYTDKKISEWIASLNLDEMLEQAS